MPIKDNLQIFIPTYNRKDFLQRTLDTFLAEDSPVKECEIFILNNNSTDGTNELSQYYSTKYTNVKHIKNKYNIGADANIVNAYTMAEKEYLWVCGDDDTYNWDNWDEVENAIANHEKAIIVARSELSDANQNNKGACLYQSTLITSVICSTSLLNDSVIKMMYNSTVFLLQHLCPLIGLINSDENFYVINKPIVIAGVHAEKGAKDTSYTRGHNTGYLSRRVKTMCWLVGFCNMCSMIKNRQIAYDAIKYATTKSLGGEQPNYKWALKHYQDKRDLMHLVDIYLNISPKDAKSMEPYIVANFSFQTLFIGLLKALCKKIFSLTKDTDHRMLTILGIKIKFKRKHIKISFKKKK